MKLLRYSLLAALALMLLVPAGASAKSLREDCIDDGRLQGKYTEAEKRELLENLPADVDAYYDCRELLQTDGSGSSRGSGKGGRGAAGAAGAAAGRATSKPSAADLARERRERAAIRALASGGGRPTLELDGRTIRPGEAGLFDLASSTHEIPGPLKLSLLAVALLTLGTLALIGRRRLLPVLSEGGRLRTALDALTRRVPRIRR